MRSLVDDVRQRLQAAENRQITLTATLERERRDRASLADLARSLDDHLASLDSLAAPMEDVLTTVLRRIREQETELNRTLVKLNRALGEQSSMRHHRFRSIDHPADRLWEGKGTSGHDPVAERYVAPPEFVYEAPVVPTLTDAQQSEQLRKHATCDKILKDSHEVSEKFLKRIQSDYMNGVLRQEKRDDLDGLRKLIHNNQHPSDCKSARILLYPQNQDCGIGAELHWMQMALTAALDSNRTLAIREDQGWTFADRTHCGDQRSFSCYFQPLSSCDVHNDDELNELLHNYEQWPLVVTAKNYSEFPNERVLHWKNMGDFAFSRHVPRWLERHHFGPVLFWWRSLLMSYQFRVQPDVQAFADDAKRRIGATPRQISLHIRDGDKIHGNKYNRVETELSTDTRELFANLERVAALCDFDRVFVSTRDPGIIDEMIKSNGNATRRLRFVWDNDELRYGNGFHTLDLLTSKLNVTDEALNAIKDLLILTDSDLFFGMMDSNYARLVAELGAATQRFLAPPVAVTKTDWIIVP